MASWSDDVEPERIAQIQHYVRTGEHDSTHAAWPGGVIERSQTASNDLLGALVEETVRRCEGLPRPARLPRLNLTDYVLQKVKPMVRGLFPTHERELVQDLLATSVVIITADNVAVRVDRF